MAVVKDTMLYTLIHDYFKVYMPKQQGASSHTIKSYKFTINALLDFVKTQKSIRLADITFKMIDRHMLAKFLDSIEDAGNSIVTRNLRLNCIRAFYKYAAKMEPTVVIFQDEIRKVPLKKSAEADVVEYMSEAAVKAILSAPDTTTEKGLRDQFLMMFFYDTAARIDEVQKIELHHLRFGKAPTVTLHGKGGKMRIVPLSEKTVQHFHNYASVFHQGVNLYSSRPLFYGRCTTKPIGATTIRELMTLHCIAAKETCFEVPEKIHPHLWRHSRAMHLYQNGMDLTLVSQWLGHSQLETTLRYAHADTEHKRKAIEAAVSEDSPLKAHINSERFIVDDDTLLKRLYGLD